MFQETHHITYSAYMQAVYVIFCYVFALTMSISVTFITLL